MSLSIKVHSAGKSETLSKFIPKDKPLMSFSDAFELVKKKYKAAFDYLEDK